MQTRPHASITTQTDGERAVLEEIRRARAEMKHGRGAPPVLVVRLVDNHIQIYRGSPRGNKSDL